MQTTRASRACDENNLGASGGKKSTSGDDMKTALKMLGCVSVFCGAVLFAGSLIGASGSETERQDEPANIAGSTTHYTVKDLGTVGGLDGTSNSLNDEGWASGVSNTTLSAGTDHAALWLED